MQRKKECGGYGRVFNKYLFFYGLSVCMIELYVVYHFKLTSYPFSFYFFCSGHFNNSFTMLIILKSSVANI